MTLAAYLAELHDAGRASSSASMAVAAACFRAKLAGQPTPAGERTARVLAGYRRTAGDRVAVHGRGAGRRRREPSDCSLGAGRSCVGADEPGRVDHRRARRKLEDLTDGGPLLCRGDRRARCRSTLPVDRS